MLWLRVTERRRNFPSSVRPDERGDLRLDTDGREAGPGVGMVEVDGAVVRAAAGGDESPLPGAKSDGFDGGAVDPFVSLAAFADVKG